MAECGRSSCNGDVRRSRIKKTHSQKTNLHSIFIFYFYLANNVSHAGHQPISKISRETSESRAAIMGEALFTVSMLAGGVLALVVLTWLGSRE